MRTAAHGCSLRTNTDAPVGDSAHADSLRVLGGRCWGFRYTSDIKLTALDAVKRQVVGRAILFLHTHARMRTHAHAPTALCDGHRLIERMLQRVMAKRAEQCVFALGRRRAFKIFFA